MADTNVNSKKSTVWTWVIVGLITLVLVLYFALRTTGDKKAPVNNSGTTGAVIMYSTLQNTGVTKLNITFLYA